MTFDSFGNRDENLNDASVKINSKNFKMKAFFNNNNLVPKAVLSKKTFVRKLFTNCKNIRNISIVGNLHHGKTSLINCLIRNVHGLNDDNLSCDFLNILNLEKQKKISINTKIYSLLLFGKKNSQVVTMIDCPGHLDFYDEVLSSIISSECAILVIDCHDGILIGSEIYLRTCLYSKTPIVILLNGIDRLIFELKMTPDEVQKRILQILDELNYLALHKVINKSVLSKKNINFFNPLNDNVCFSALSQGWIFNLNQFSGLYMISQPSICLSQKDLSERIWNDKKLKISKKNKKSLFELYILEPLFKIVIFCGLESFEEVKKFIEVDLGFYGFESFEFLKFKEDLVTFCLSLFFSGCKNFKMFSTHSALLDSILINSNSYSVIFKKKYKHLNLNKNEKIAISFKTNYMFVEKKNSILAKLINGKFSIKSRFVVITEKHRFYNDQKTFKVIDIDFFFLPLGRYSLGLSKCPKGLFVVFHNSNIHLKKSGLITGLNSHDNYKIYLFTFRSYLNCFSISNSFFSNIKPDLLKNFEYMVKSLRIFNQKYYSLVINVQRSGNILIKTPGKLYLECLIYDINQNLSNVCYESIKINITEYNSILLKKTFQKYIFDKKIEIFIAKLRKSYRNGRLKQFNFELNQSKNDFRMKSGYIINSIQSNTKIKLNICNHIWYINSMNLKYEPVLISGKLLKKSILRKNIIDSFSDVFCNNNLKKPIIGIEVLISELKYKKFDYSNSYFCHKMFNNILKKFTKNKKKIIKKNMSL